MHAMEIERFHRLLFETRSYKTPAATPTLPDRLLGRLDAWYYWKVFCVVLRASRKARKGPYGCAEWGRSAHEVIQAAEACGGRFSITGLEHVAAVPGAKVFVANHMSTLETLALPAALLPFGPLTTVVKQSLLDYPLFGVVMRSLKPIGVTRRHPRADLKEVLVKGAAALRQGTSVLVFPQATRTPGFSADQFNSIGVKLASRAGVPVLPVAVKSDFQGIGRICRDIGKLHRDREIRFRVAAPLDAGGDTKQVHREVTVFIRETLRSWGGAAG